MLTGQDIPFRGEHCTSVEYQWGIFCNSVEGGGGNFRGHCALPGDSSSVEKVKSSTDCYNWCLSALSKLVLYLSPSPCYHLMSVVLCCTDHDYMQV